MKGIVLAAGEGRRMGLPKARLTLGGVPLVQRHVEMLTALGCTEVRIVVRPDVPGSVQTTAFRNLVQKSCTVHWLRSARFFARRTASMAESLDVGLEGLAPVDVVVVTPVDVVPARMETLAALARALPAFDAVTPTFEGRGGHPVVARVGAIHGPGTPLRDRLAALGARRLRLPVDDSAVVTDLDTPADLRALAVEHRHLWRGVALADDGVLRHDPLELGDLVRR